MKLWTIILLLLLSVVLCLGMAACTKDPVDLPDDKDENEGKEPGADGEPQTPTTTQGVSLSDFDPTKTYEAPNYFSLDITDYVQLGRYKNMSVELTDMMITILNPTVEEEILSILEANSPEAKITNRVTAWGDTVVMDYVGKLDGVAFGGGTSIGATIELSETNRYVPGFVDGIVGLTPGVMTEVPVTFPTNYGNTDLAGKDVIFEMTVHYIVGNPELTDAFVVEYTDGAMTTTDEFRAATRARLEKERYDAILESAMWTKITENALVVQYPADAVLYYYCYYYVMYSQYAAMYGTTYENLLSANGMSPEYIFSYCKEMVKSDLVRFAVYADGAYTCTQEEYDAELDAYTKENYDSLRAAMIADGAAEYTEVEARAYFHANYENQLKDTVLSEKVYAALKDSIKVTVTKVDTGLDSEDAQ